MNQAQSCTIAIIGAGPGGYVAAIKAAQLGENVALIEKNFLGGVCLNVGCIPTKCLLSHAKILSQIQNAKKFGITIDSFHVDYEEIIQKKNAVVHTLRKNLESLIRANKIKIYSGEASFISPNTIQITGKDQCILHTKKTIIATGSKGIESSLFPIDCHLVHNSTSILNMTKLPKRLIVIGGGYIGCEFSSLFSTFGVHVTIIEALPSVLTSQGTLLASHLTKAFQKRGIEIKTNTKVEKIDKSQNKVIAHLSDGSSIETNLCLVCIGRSPNSSNLGIEKIGIRTNEKKAIVVNEKMETNSEGIYAVGDVNGKMLLAHVASHQGFIAAMNASGHHMIYDDAAIPSVVFSDPELASVGKTLDVAIKEGYDAASSLFPFQALGKAIAALDTEGFVEIVHDKKNDQILGARMMGSEASIMIAEMGLAIQNRLTLDQIIQTIHTHPTLPEAWHEAAMVAKGTPLNLPPKKDR